MPIVSLFSSMVKLISSKVRFVDTFSRTVSGSLGGIWSNIRDTWYANGTAAQSDNAATNYPIAAIPLASTNQIVSASVGSGTGVAFWLTDSGNWWASTSYNTQSSYTYSCNPQTLFCFNNASISCANGMGSSSTGCADPSYIGSCSALQTNMSSACGGSAVTSFDCGGGTTGVYYSTCTGYTYSYYLKLIKSVSGTISNVVSDVSLASQPAAIKITTSTNTITAQAYSDTAMTNALGSPVTTTPSSPLTGLKAGIIKAPTSYNQTSPVDNFSAEG